MTDPVWARARDRARAASSIPRLQATSARDSTRARTTRERGGGEWVGGKCWWIRLSGPGTPQEPSQTSSVGFGNLWSEYENIRTKTYMLVIIVIYALIFFIFCFCSKNKWEHSLNSSNFHDFKAGPEFLQAAMLMQHKVEKILVCSTVLKACDMFTYVVQKNSHLFVINQKPQTRYSLISKCFFFFLKNQIFSQFLV